MNDFLQLKVRTYYVMPAYNTGYDSRHRLETLTSYDHSQAVPWAARTVGVYIDV
ncbi:hypothetical protein GCM10010911_32080 [Paenibacillus nasutitermitis]|uniref:Uncharacterized protein n=1 Tax=Paenibacillus nasutitermitis TaxID=1652958 RepID=A0A916Z1M3_9BACL|nr:hypothetical protein GCM10010911_32080 [Paenibacillus nasutitermitis]